MLMEAVLERVPGVRLVCAAAGGRARAGAGDPTTVLLDIQLPGIDGFEVLRRLRAMRARRHSVVAVTTR